MDLTDRHPATVRQARRFAYGHLPPHLQAVSKPFHDLATQLLDLLPDSPDLTECLLRLWESKNLAVVAATDLPPMPPGGIPAGVVDITRAGLQHAAHLTRDNPAA